MLNMMQDGLIKQQRINTIYLLKKELAELKLQLEQLKKEIEENESRKTNK